MAAAANPVTQYFTNIWNTAYSVFEGMAVTLSYMTRKPTTVQWPDRMEDKRPLEEQLPERYRGILELDVGKCNACMTCERDCPIDCIVIEVKKNPETKIRVMSSFSIDVAKCMYCALCTEGCPNEAIYHTKEFAHSTPDMLDLVLEFVEDPKDIIKLPKGEVAEAAIAKRGDKVRSLLAKKGARRTPRPVQAPVTSNFSERVAYEGQPEIEELEKMAAAFAESHRPKVKAKPKPKPAVEPAPKVEEPKVEEPKAEEPKAEEPKAEEPPPSESTDEKKE